MAKPDTNPRCQAYFAYLRIKSNASVLVASLALSITLIAHVDFSV